MAMTGRSVGGQESTAPSARKRAMEAAQTATIRCSVGRPAKRNQRTNDAFEIPPHTPIATPNMTKMMEPCSPEAAAIARPDSEQPTTHSSAAASDLRHGIGLLMHWGLTFDMRGGRQLAKPDVGRPLDGRVSRHTRGPATCRQILLKRSRQQSEEDPGTP